MDITSSFVQGSWEDAMRAQLEAWFEDPAWVDAAPDMRVTVGPNALCQLDGVATVALPPDAVFDIVCDPYNRRVFKNVKAVNNLRVVSDCNGVREEEMDMTFAFQLPFFTGSFDAHVRMVKDRTNRKMTYALTRPGFMRRFEGSWTVEPKIVPSGSSIDPPAVTCLSSPAASVDLDSDVSADGSSSSNSSACSSPDNQMGATSNDAVRVASRLVLRQLVQPSLAPPAIFKRCLHSILQMATRDVMQVFQEEAGRVRRSRGKGEGEDDAGGRKGGASLTSRVWGMVWSQKA